MKTTGNDTKVRRRSGQREAIWEFLKDRTDHPTADAVYTHVRENYPNISLGTVYRNLALLTELGEIRHIPLRDGADRYDGRMEPHTHFYCRTCGRLIDLPPVKTSLLKRSVEGTFDGIIESHNLTFSGICGRCIPKS